MYHFSITDKLLYLYKILFILYDNIFYIAIEIWNIEKDPVPKND